MIISSYDACKNDGHFWQGVVQERQGHMFYIKLIQPHGLNSNLFLIDHTPTKYKNVPGMEPTHASGKAYMC
jgi:hypothetical protein